MFGRAVASVVTAIAILAASVAWAGWVYLHTVADPTRSNRIAHAILDDPAARRELAADISDSLATAADKALAARHVPATVDGADPILRSAVDAALSDPRIATNIVDAITAEHAQALGATPANPAVIDTGLLLAAVRAHLAPADAQLANALPAVAPAQIRLPAVKIPFARQARQWAKRWVHILVLGALAGLLVGLLLGDRAAVLRRWGFWAISAAATWAVLPPLAVWAGDTWAKSQAAVIRAIVRGATGGVNAVAITLGVGGVAAVAASFLLPRLGSLAMASVSPPPGGSHRRGRGPVAPAGSPRAGTEPGFDRAAAPASAPPRRWATDTWAPQGPRTEEVPVIYDRSGRLASRTPVGPVAPPASGLPPDASSGWNSQGRVAPDEPGNSGVAQPRVEPSASSASSASSGSSADSPNETAGGSWAPRPRPVDPSPRPTRRPGVSRHLLDGGSEDTTGTG